MVQELGRRVFNAFLLSRGFRGLDAVMDDTTDLEMFCATYAAGSGCPGRSHRRAAPEAMLRPGARTTTWQPRLARTLLAARRDCARSAGWLIERPAQQTRTAARTAQQPNSPTNDPLVRDFRSKVFNRFSMFLFFYVFSIGNRQSTDYKRNT